MSLKPEKIPRRSYLSRKAEARARRTAKRAATRVMRRMERMSPEDAPTRRPLAGWID